MIDIKELRDHPEVYIKASEDKRIAADVPKLLEIDAELKGIKAKLQDIATEKNRIGKSVPKLSDEEKGERWRSCRD